MIAGSGIIRSRNAIGNARTRSRAHPKRKRTMPTVVPRSEMRVRNSSDPSTPADQHEDAADEDARGQQPSAAGRREKAIAPLPGEVGRNRDDEEAVRVVVVGRPVQDKLRQHVAVQKQETGRDQQRRADSSSSRWSCGRSHPDSKRPFRANHRPRRPDAGSSTVSACLGYR